MSLRSATGPRPIGRIYTMIGRLIEEIIKKDAPVVVGMDPNLAFIPGKLLESARSAAEEDLP